MVRKVGVYSNEECPNEIIRNVEDNKLEINIEDYCAWCDKKLHKWKLKEIVELKD